jgi:hypothetical protein
MSNPCSTLDVFHDGELPPDAARAFRAHLPGCDACFQALHDRAQLGAAVRGRVPEAVREAAKEALRLDEGMSKGPWSVKPDHEEEDHAHVIDADGNEVCRIEGERDGYDGSEEQGNAADRRLAADPEGIARSRTLLGVLARHVLAGGVEGNDNG